MVKLKITMLPKKSSAVEEQPAKPSSPMSTKRSVSRAGNSVRASTSSPTPNVTSSTYKKRAKIGASVSSSSGPVAATPDISQDELEAFLVSTTPTATQTSNPNSATISALTASTPTPRATSMSGDDHRRSRHQPVIRAILLGIQSTTTVL
ncbi:hypothetical protein EJ08DRAFT_666598 [Tothia fuscella]|uniref:Uncharacterized protein n=1 Tax=Tothia fuscella TaxID=1048955 RepID=A0A9P4NE81_9PEZI|nr:hypothetical protein EJ08DRAFT_666598 [Tothia fuscella]